MVGPLDVVINWFNENRINFWLIQPNLILYFFGTKQNNKTDKLHVKVLNECLPQKILNYLVLNLTVLLCLISMLFMSLINYPLKLAYCIG